MSMASGAIQARREDGDDFENVLHQLLFEGGRRALCNADDLNALLLADLEDQLGAKAEKAIFVSQHEPLHLAGQQQVQQVLQASLVHVEARTQIVNEFKAPPTTGTKRL